MDAYLLAGFVRAKPGQRMIDLGTGTGTVPILLASFHPGLSLVGVEIQPRLAAAARANVAANAMADKVEILEQDVRVITRFLPAGHFSQVVSNPPYYKLRTGRVNPSMERAMARHEIALTLQQLVETASVLLEDRGVLNLIFTPERLPELLGEMKTHRIAPNRLRMVHSYRASPATLALVAGTKDGRSHMAVEPALIIYEKNRRYTAEVEALYGRAAGLRWMDP